MKAYKGFDKDMKCRGKQYEEGKDYKEDRAQACSYGMHACEYPLDCFGYYPPGTSVYHEVEQSGALSKNGDDTKVASTEMHIGARLDIAGIVKAAIEYTKSRTTTEHTEPELATAGNRGAATARGSASSGENGLSVARGNGVKVKGGLGAILVIAEENKYDYDIKDYKVAVVDGEKIKADTWYELKEGELVEVEEQ